MKSLLSITLSLLCLCCFGQTKYQKLIAAEYKGDSPGAGNYTYLVSYNFKDGLLISKDTILGAETFKKGVAGSYVRFDLGKNFIYKNRYVVSGTGNVIDIHKKALVIEESDEFVKASGDTMIFHRRNAISGTGFLMLDLQTGKYNFINNKDRDKGKEERTSPDNRHYLSIDKTAIPYKIWLHEADSEKKRILVNDAQHGPNMTEFPTIETWWLNPHSFLYAVHEIKFNASREDDAKTTLRQFDINSDTNEIKFDVSGKDYATVTLHQFDINSNSDKIFFVLDSVARGRANGNFFADKTGQLIYRTSGWDYYTVDTNKRVLINYLFYELGFGSSMSIRYNKEGTIIRYKNSEIDQLRCSNEVAGEGVIAVTFDNAGPDHDYVRGIKVWSKLTNNWTTINNIPWLEKIIGWVDEESKGIPE